MRIDFRLTPRRSLLLFLLMVVGVALFYLFRQKPLPEASAESIGMSTVRLARIDTVLQQYVNRQKIPGAVALVVRNGKIVYHKGFGYNTLEKNAPLSRNAIFRIASQSKAIVSAAVLILYEEGKFLLDDPISNYIPAFRNPKVMDNLNLADTTFTTVPARREITIRDLLTHTSGIGYAQIGFNNAIAIYAKHGIPSGIGTPHYQLSEVMGKLATLPLMHQPGERFTYGLNTDVLGYLIEVVTGKPLDEFLRERVFDPLGMEDTQFYLSPDKAPRLATLFAEYEEGETSVAQNWKDYYPDFPLEKGTYFSGGAGLTATAYDYAVFLQTILNGGEFNGNRILAPATVRLMTTNQIGEINLTNKKFGLGFAIATEKEAAKGPVSVGTLDWSGIYGTTYWADPQERLIGILMIQKYPASYGDLGEKFKVLVYQAITQTNEKEESL
ncbi:serine hydrolase domain-containing protein [Telluribacter sp.]|jgi:CubicO group peptidase (beta-lactamase class C family)|uniref:serine hydrolase domain-containing protein n=1 Tax=Telluribacter sp. TaxID=1978767 RepID=UPI002E11EDCD|nr:serine hydrolase domain-containing protein [Telluribacter sp.]